MKLSLIGCLVAAVLVACTPAERQRAADDAASISHSYAICVERDTARASPADTRAAQAIAVRCLLGILPDIIALAVTELSGAMTDRRSQGGP